MSSDAGAPARDRMDAQRQSPWAALFIAIRLVASVGGIQVAIAAFFVITGPLDGRLFVLVPLMGVGVLGVAVLSWWRFTFGVVDDEFVVESGVLHLDRLVVPIDRIQSISTEQQLLHRLLGVVRLSLDTAGSEDTEFRLDAVSTDVAGELRRLVTAVGSEDDALSDARTVPTSSHDEPHAQRIVSHTPARLVLAALTAWPLAGLVVLGPLIAAAGQAGDDLQDLPVRPPEVDLDQARWWWIPLFVVVGLVALVALNVSRIILRDWNHVVEADGTQLRRTSGLLSRRLDTRAISKVQLLTTTINPLQRAARLSAVELASIGDGGLDVLGCDPLESVDITRRVGLTPIDVLAPDRRIDRAEIGRAVRITAGGAGVVAASAWLLIGWWAALAFVAVPIEWARRRRHVRRFRWDITREELAARGGIVDAWTRQTLLRKTNGVRLRRTWFERRHGLATVVVSTAAGAITIGMLPVDDAAALRDRVLASVLTDDRAWM